MACEGEELYRGPMNSLVYPLNISRLLGKVMAYEDVIKLDFTIKLPGRESGNEFQGSSLVAELVFYTICSKEIIVDPEDPETDPEDEEEEEEKKEKKIPPEKPKQSPVTRGGGVPLALILCGAAMVATGLVLKRKYCV